MWPLVEDAILTLTVQDADQQAVPGTQTGRQVAALRVLHVLDHLDTGGTEYGVLKVLQGLTGQRFDSRICVMRGARSEIADSPLLVGRVIRVGDLKVGSQRGVSRLARVFREWQPHIVHSRNWGAIEALPAARWAGVPVAIHSEHGYELDMLKGLPLRRRLARRVFYRLADAVFTVTHDLSSYHARQVGWKEGRIGTIYNGVDTKRFAPRPADRHRVREALGLPEGRFILGAVGRLVSIKDFPTLLKAAERVLSLGHDISVLIVGAGPERTSLERIAAALGDRVHFLGERNDLPDLFNAIDGFVQTSICEGMSNTILEAMASAVPVIATHVGGNPELVVDRTTGLLFPPLDASALAEKIALLVSRASLRQAFGDAARDRAAVAPDRL